MENASPLLAKNFCSLVVPPSSTFSSSFSSSSFRTVVNKKIVFQKRQRSILQPCQGTLSAHYTWNLDSSTVMDQHLSCYFTDQFISSIPSNSLPNRSLETYFIHDHFNPCFLQNGHKRSSPDAMFKAERYTKASQGSYWSFCCIQKQDYVVKYMCSSEGWKSLKGCQMTVMGLQTQINLFEPMGFCSWLYKFLEIGSQHFIQINCWQGSARPSWMWSWL